jgi:hypothetical protein
MDCVCPPNPPRTPPPRVLRAAQVDMQELTAIAPSAEGGENKAAEGGLFPNKYLKELPQVRARASASVRASARACFLTGTSRLVLLLGRRG